MGRKARTDWSALAKGYRGVSWADRDVDIAKAVGCSRERVRQARVELKAPRSPRARRRMGTTADKIAAMDVSRMTPLDIASETGCTPAYARMVLKAGGRPHLRPPDGRRKWKYRWGDVTPAMWRDMTDAAVAEVLGVGSPAVVTQWRRRRGIMKKPRAGLRRRG
jgi:hypothetical protein